MSVNKVMLIGNLGADPELRYLPSGQGVCEFRIATSERWTSRDGQQKEDTQWHRIVVWGKQGEQCKEYLAKGRQVYVEGRLRTRQWDDKQGQKHYMTEVVAQRVQFLGGGSRAGADSRGAGRETSADMPDMTIPPPEIGGPSGPADDEIPF